MKYRIVSLLALATALTAAAYAADAPTPNLNQLGSVKITASPGDSIFAAKNHHHQYIYVSHVREKTVDVIDVSNPASPRQLSGKAVTRALRNRQAVINVAENAGSGTARVLDLTDPNEPRVVAEFPNAISATSDSRKLIYVLDETSLRILSTTPQQQQEDDSWFWNANTPG